jgi:5-methylcytosine-specific restriction endonuclease McrA
MARTRICPGTPSQACGVPVSLPGGHCPRHPSGLGAGWQRQPRRREYDTRQWRTLRGRYLEGWIAARGWTCAGFRRASHPARPLQVDHVTPLVLGGAVFEVANLQALCGPCNARKALAQRVRR